MNINNEAKQLARTFSCELNKGSQADSTLMLRLYNEIKELLQAGVQKDEILNKVQTYKANHPKATVMPTVPVVMREQYKASNKQEDNLIEPGVFYFHPRLQITPGMPVIAFDILHGIFESNYSNFYLEMVDKFTLNDIMDYALSKLNVVDKTEAATLGSLRYLLGKYDCKAPYNNLDLLLYMIDAASGLMKDLDMAPMSKLLKLDDFIQEGTKLYHDAYNTKKSAGMDKVIPR